MKSRAPVRFAIVVFAALLGFTSLALLHAPSDSYDFLSRYKSSVKWTSYVTLSKDATSHYTQGNHASKNVSTLFQKRLLKSLPVPCAKGAIIDKKYSRFLKSLQTYANFHRVIKNSGSRTLTWQCSMQEYCGGLGDRIRGVSYALLLAMFSRRKLVIFWEGPSEGTYLHPYMVDWRDERVYGFLRGQKDVSDESSYDNTSSLADPFMFKFQVILDSSGKIANDVSSQDMQYYQRVIGSNSTNVIITTNLEPSALLDPQRSGDQEWIRSGLVWTGLSHLTPAELDNVVGLVFRFLFRIDDKVLEEMQVALGVLGLQSPYTALHLRTGFAGMAHQELKRHPKLMHDTSDWHSGLQCALSVADKMTGDNGSGLVFLATDSNLVKDLATAKYGHRVRTLRNSLIHVDKVAKQSHVVSTDEAEGMVVVWVELLLLARAEVLVRGESGYSWTAGLLCGLNDNRTVLINHCSY